MEKTRRSGSTADARSLPSHRRSRVSPGMAAPASTGWTFREALSSAKQSFIFPLRILIDWFQITSSFGTVFLIPWPPTYELVMSRVSFIRLNFSDLPALSCFNQNPSFYFIFDAYTWGIACAPGPQGR